MFNFRMRMGGTASASGSWDIGNVTYTSKTKSFSSQDSHPVGGTFSADGKTFYMVGYTTVTIYQYTLSTAWDISTATYSGKSKLLSAQCSGPISIKITSDGLTVYVLDNIKKAIYVYGPTTAWDISTASYSGRSFGTSGQTGDPAELDFSSDGTKAYILDYTNKTVFQYTLTTAWDVTTAGYASKSKSVSTQESSPLGLAMKSDGTAMFILGLGKTLYQYTLNTPWDVSTAVYVKSKSVSTQTNQPYGIIITPNGTLLYVVDYANVAIYEYNL